MAAARGDLSVAVHCWELCSSAVGDMGNMVDCWMNLYDQMTGVDNIASLSTIQQVLLPAHRFGCRPRGAEGEGHRGWVGRLDVSQPNLVTGS